MYEHCYDDTRNAGVRVHISHVFSSDVTPVMRPINSYYGVNKKSQGSQLIVHIVSTRSLALVSFALTTVYIILQNFTLKITLDDKNYKIENY